jgi:hypothetical protein
MTGTHTAAAKRKLAAAMKSRWAAWRAAKKANPDLLPLSAKKTWRQNKAKKAALKAHAPASATNGANGGSTLIQELTPLKMVGWGPKTRHLAKQAVRELAVQGAQQRLDVIDRERDVLIMFIKGHGAFK